MIYLQAILNRLRLIVVALIQRAAANRANLLFQLRNVERALAILANATPRQPGKEFIVRHINFDHAIDR